MGKYEELLSELVELPTTPDRTGKGTKRLFNRQVTYDLTEGFPLLTTKRVAWKSAFAETLWFISGSTDRRDLQWFQHGEFKEDRFDIWKGNCLDRLEKDTWKTRFSGYNLGKMYGEFWRHQYGVGGNDEFYINEKLVNSMEYTNCLAIYDDEYYYEHNYDCHDVDNNYIEEDIGGVISLMDSLSGLSDKIIRSKNENVFFPTEWENSRIIMNELKSFVGYQEVIDFMDGYNGINETKLYLNFNHEKVSRHTATLSLHNPTTYSYLDQLQRCIGEIKNNPTSRRIIMDSWNPRTTDNAVLAICHPFVQFFVDDKELSMFVMIRSNDFFLGHPFNLAGYALLLEIVAKECGLTAKNITIQMGDVHLYSDHEDQAREQLTREPYDWCKIKLADNKRFDEYLLEDIEIIGYESHENIKAEMAV